MNMVILRDTHWGLLGWHPGQKQRVLREVLFSEDDAIYNPLRKDIGNVESEVILMKILGFLISRQGGEDHNSENDSSFKSWLCCQ